MLTLYYAPGTCALASHIALIDAGADYELKRLDFRRGDQQSEHYLRINPKGRVPAMVTARGVLTETPALLAFIAQSFPKAKLAPLDDPFAFAEIQTFNSYLCATLHVAHAHKMRGSRWADEASSFEDMKRKLPKSVGACFEMVETRMHEGPWVLGDTYTIADPYLFTVAQWMEGDGLEAGRFPKVLDHRTRMAERANVKRALSEEQAPAT